MVGIPHPDDYDNEGHLMPADRLMSLLIPHEPAGDILVKRVSPEVKSHEEGEPAFI